ncbi:MAG: hypothetical protein MI867_23155, partial [Pseudomonadales bacterium]|nr:hypothetical protein [Pseudomonadales bacterium]
MSAEQRLNRLRWVVEKIEEDGRISRFPDFNYTVHIDEKWFTLAKDGDRAWIWHDEHRDAAPTASSKSRLPKLMFLAAVGRPQWRPDRTFCDGLIGVWPFVKVERAQRNSKNRAVGSEILMPVNVDSQAFLEKMQSAIFPAIRRAYYHAKRCVVVQMDGARAHHVAGIRAGMGRSSR